MPTDVERLWNSVTHAAVPRSSVRCWGAARGYTGGMFRIDAVDDTSVTVSGARMRMPRRISKGDCTRIGVIWDRYITGDFSRSRIVDLSHNSTYILGLLRAATDPSAR